MAVMQSERAAMQTERGGGETLNHNEDSGQLSEDIEDQILLERDGKFRVVNTDDIMADDQPRSPLSSSPSSSDEAAAALLISSLSMKTTSGGPRGRGTFSQRSDGTQPPAAPRSKSAVTLPGSRRRSTDYSSTHRLTDEQKRQVQY